MRKAQKDGSISHRPPTNLSADGMDAWYLSQKQRELELRKRRQEAEAMLRGYRSSYEGMARSSSMKGFGSPMSAVSETLDDPDCHSVYNNAPSRRHTIHAGDIPTHLMPKRGLQTEFDNETNDNNEYNLKTPANNVSFANAFEEAAAREEEKKSENEPRSSYRGRHSMPGRPIGETPLPIDEKHANRALLPETIWRDFIVDGKYDLSLGIYCTVVAKLSIPVLT